MLDSEASIGFRGIRRSLEGEARMVGPPPGGFPGAAFYFGDF